MAKRELQMKKRMLAILVIFTCIAVLLILRTGYLQTIQGEELQKQAIAQQTQDKQISAKRGTIYDRNGKALAISASVFRVSVSPNIIKEEKNADKVIDTLSSILELDRESVEKKVNSNTYYQDIKRKIEKDVADKILEADLAGVYVSEDTKRYYPYGNFASHVIGFTGDDNQGLNGIEMVFDKELKGTPGRIVSASNAKGTQMPYKYEQYIDAKDGMNVVLTIDEVIQHFTEKYLKQAYIDNKVAAGAACIVMNPKTGEIVAMASQPDFDLNAPFTLDEATQAEIDKLQGDEKKNKQNEALQKMWRNKAVVDCYEPGSTFKIITASMALEENVVKDSDRFTCTGSKKVGPFNISCHKHAGHGTQTFEQGVQNSCNPVFMELGARIGADKFIEYYNAFGFRDKSGIELPGEAIGPFYTRENFNEVELATSSFGQGPQVTPLQLISAVSAVANGGKLLQPYLVKQLTDQEGNVVQSFETTVVREVISESTSKRMCSILESVVSEGTGKNAYIKGFRVAGKTGTSEKLPRGSNKNIASFIGFAPADDPQLVCLVLLDEPNGDQYFGGTIAAPVVRDILNDSLTYLGVEPEYSGDEVASTEVMVPDVTGSTVDAAKKMILAQNLKVKVIGNGEEIISQVPQGHFSVTENSTVILYTSDTESLVTVPDVTKLGVNEAKNILTNAGLNPKISGIADGDKAGQVVSVKQEPAAGEKVSQGTVVTVEFVHTDVD